MKRSLFLPLFCCLALSGCAGKSVTTTQKNEGISYPETKRIEVKEKLHNVEIVDPYRWLENSDDPNVKSWTASQNNFTQKLVDSYPQTAKITERLREIWKYDSMRVPYKRGEKLFYRKKVGLQNQPVLHVSQNGTERVLVDPNTINAEGTTAMDWYYVSPKGKYVAYGLSENGSEQSVLHVVDVETGKNIEAPITGCRYASVGWTPDETGFFYTRKLDGKGPGETDMNQSIRFHKLGDNPETDRIIEKASIKEAILVSSISEDGKWLLITEYKGSSGKAKILVHNVEKGETKPVVENHDRIYEGEIFKGKIYLKTDEGDALNYKVVAIDAETLERNTVVEEDKDFVIDGVTFTDGKLLILGSKDVASKIRIKDLDSGDVRELKLPTFGSIFGISASPEDKDIYLSFTSFAYPPAVLHYKGESEPEVFFQAKVNVDPSVIETKQVFYPSKDGTKVPMFIIHKKGIKLDGNNPTVIVGYGGFNVSYSPYFSSNNFSWIEQGGVYAVANIRGGGEYGEKWHRSGMLDKKQNCFDDFAWAMKYLINEKYTRPEKLGIKGGSNGGLLTGTMITQYPELFSVALVAVPLLDMLRYHKFLIGRYWVPEYGSADNADQFSFIYNYSPYHNIKKEGKFPAVILTAGESDSRVHPLHAKKMAAMLQHENRSETPILLWVETKAGHGQGKSTEAAIRENSLIWSFFYEQLGVEYKNTTKKVSKTAEKKAVN